MLCRPAAAEVHRRGLFTKLDDKIKEVGLSWDECIGVCRRCWSPAGRERAESVLHVAPRGIFTRGIHREALASKTLDPERKSVLEMTIEMKSCPLNTGLFARLCSELGSSIRACPPPDVLSRSTGPSPRTT